MTFVMVTATFPPENSKQIGTVFTKLPKMPEFVKLLHTLITQDEDMKVFSLYEIEDDKMHEGIIAISKRYIPYHEVSGFKYKIQPTLTVREALPLVGLAAP